MASKPGYRIGRGPDGLTDRRRQLLDLLGAGRNRGEAALALGVSHQRVAQLVKELREGGFLAERDGRLIVAVPDALEASGAVAHEEDEDAER